MLTMVIYFHLNADVTEIDSSWLFRQLEKYSPIKRTTLSIVSGSYVAYTVKMSHTHMTTRKADYLNRKLDRIVASSGTPQARWGWKVTEDQG